MSVACYVVCTGVACLGLMAGWWLAVLVLTGPVSNLFSSNVIHLYGTRVVSSNALTFRLPSYLL